MGEPRVLAQEERERLGLPDPSGERGPRLLEVAAMVLTVIFWPVGVLLAWLSPRWFARDKVAATALPALGRLPQAERFHWLVSPRSTVIQTSPVHSGLSTDLAAAMEKPMDEMVRPPSPSDSTSENP